MLKRCHQTAMMSCWGDKNTKFFHATTIQRRQRNKISMLQDDNQAWVRDPKILKMMTTGYFSHLFQRVGHRDYLPILNQCPQVVTNEMNMFLIAPITKKEVREATFQLGLTKAPGPDGLNGLFYQHHWDILQDELFSSVQHFFNSGIIPPDLNRTIIALS